MPVAVAAEATSAVRALARRAHRSLGIERLLDAERLPLNHPDRERLIHVLSGLVGARFVHGDADVRRGPRRRRVNVAHAAHVSSLEILLALIAHSKPGIGKLHVQCMLESGRSERQYVLWVVRAERNI